MRLAFLLLFTTGALAQSASGAWVRNVVTDKMYGTNSVVYAIPASSAVGSREHRSPQLAIICQNGHFQSIDYDVDAVLAADEADGNGAKSMIQYRVDDKRIRIEWWDQTNDSQHAFSRSARLKELLAANTLMLRTTTFTGDVVTDEFNVEGLNADMFHEDCGIRTGGNN